MKILHFADVHLGSDDTGPIVSETGLSARLTDFLTSLDQIVGTVEAAGIDLVLFAGDAFKTRTPSPTLVREFARRIRQMSSWCPVVLVPGNHDTPGAHGKAHTVEIFRTLAVRNVYVADRPQLLPIETKSGMVQVVAIPWPTRHYLMAQEKALGLSADQVNRLIAEAVEETIERLARSADPALPAVLLGHLTVDGGTFGSERSVALGGDVLIPLEAVARPEFDYVALGHLHRYQTLYETPPVIYSGSIERIDFGEEEEQKGFVVIDLGREEAGPSPGAYVETEFVPLDVRDFLTIEVSADGTDPMASVMEAIAAHDLSDTVVRVIINTTAEGEALLDEAMIQEYLRGAFRVASFTKKVERTARARLGELDYREMDPLELLEAYFETKGTPEQEREALLEAARELMREGEK